MPIARAVAAYTTIIILLAASPARAADIQINADFPGGNIVVDSIEGDTVRLHPDLRDTEGDWFYWAFRVRGAQGRTVKFIFTQRMPVFTVRGPAISLDDGATWSWLGAESIAGNGFTYTFAAPTDSALFSMAMPYTQRNLDAFLKRIGDHPALRIDTLTTSRKGRPVERLHLGDLGGQPRFRILLMARHHACEMMADYCLEGVIEAVLAKDELGDWYRQHVELVILPFMDKDGVEDGDQGKNRKPRDHNRDYSDKSVHVETAALREWAPKWSDGKLLAAIDVHCPALRGRRNEVIYQVGSPDPERWSQQQLFAQCLAKSIKGPLPYDPADDLPHGKEWNIPANATQGAQSARWAATLPGIKLATTIELPYANAAGKEVNQETARRFGHDLAAALRAFATREADR